jgi:hypothetical protein
MGALIGASVLLSNCPGDTDGRRERSLPVLPLLRPSRVPTSSVEVTEGRWATRRQGARTASLRKAQAIVVSGFYQGFGSHGGSITEGQTTPSTTSVQADS